MAQHGREAAGTLTAALLWAVFMFLFFIGLGFATHALVEMTIKRDSEAWRAAVGATAAMFVVAITFALVLIGGRGIGAMPGRIRRRRIATLAGQAPPPRQQAPRPEPQPQADEHEHPRHIEPEPTQEIPAIRRTED